MSLAQELLNESMGRKPERAPITPYATARRQWDDRLGTVVMNAKHWRLGFFGLLFATLSLTGGILYAMTRSLVEPVVITVDKNTGVTNVVGKPSEQKYTPQQNEISYFLGHLIRLLRTVPLDPVIVRSQWNEAYRFMRQSAATKLNDWARLARQSIDESWPGNRPRCSCKACCPLLATRTSCAGRNRPTSAKACSRTPQRGLPTFTLEFRAAHDRRRYRDQSARHLRQRFRVASGPGAFATLIFSDCTVSLRLRSFHALYSCLRTFRRVCQCRLRCRHQTDRSVHSRSHRAHGPSDRDGHASRAAIFACSANGRGAAATEQSPPWASPLLPADLAPPISHAKSPREIAADKAFDEEKDAYDLKQRARIAEYIGNATQRPTNAHSTGSATVYSYRDGQIYLVYAGLDRLTDIELQPGETLTADPVAGDTEGWIKAQFTSGSGSSAADPHRRQAAR